MSETEGVIFIFAGGASRRMGFDKRTLLLDGQTLMERTVSRLETLGLPMFILGTPPAEICPSIERIADRAPGSGPLAALADALEKKKPAWCFAVASDMPDIDPRFVAALLDRADENAILAPKADMDFHPLHAVYPLTCLTSARRLIASGHYSLHSLLHAFRTLAVPGDLDLSFDPASMSNLNTPEDLERWRSRSLRT